MKSLMLAILLTFSAIPAFSQTISLQCEGDREVRTTAEYINISSVHIHSTDWFVIGLKLPQVTQMLEVKHFVKKSELCWLKAPNGIQIFCKNSPGKAIYASALRFSGQTISALPTTFLTQMRVETRDNQVGSELHNYITRQDGVCTAYPKP